MRKTWAIGLVIAAGWGCRAGPPAPPPARDAAARDAHTAPPDAAEIQIIAGEPEIIIELPDAGLKVSRVPDAGAPRRARRAWRRRAYRRRSARPLARRRGVKGGMMGTIRRHQGEVARCYGQVALNDPTVAGRLTVQWTLAADGRPTAVAVTNTLGNTSVGRCVKRTARTWRFPPPAGGLAVVSYTYNLRIQ